MPPPEAGTLRDDWIARAGTAASYREAVGHTDPETALRLSREAARLRGVAEDALPHEPRPGVVYVQVEPRRIISWDYGRDSEAT